MSAPNIVDVADVAKTYEPSPTWLRLLARSAVREPVHALAGVDLRLEAGNICAVVGPNGAGKTTLFRVLAGLTTADRGVVRVGGLDPGHAGRQVRAMIGWMPTERRSLFLRQTSRQNLAFHGRLREIPARALEARIDEVLELVGLGGKGDVAPQAFSDGMRARLLLARALLAKPRLLILDEPTGPIDPVAAFAILELIREMVAHLDIAALISSHRLEEIAALRARVHLLDHGRTVFDGDLGSLQARRAATTVLTFASPELARAAGDLLAGDAVVADVSVDGPGVNFRRPVDVPVGRLLSSLGPLAADLVTVDEHPAPLRDVLASFYADAGRP